VSDDHPSEEEQLALPLPLSSQQKFEKERRERVNNGWMDYYGEIISAYNTLLDKPFGGGDRLFPFPIPFLPYFYDDEKRKKRVILGTE
jgi:hypothetical protein